MTAVYTVVSDTVESTTGDPNIVQVDAPAGFFGVSTYALFEGSSTPEPYAAYQVLKDGSDRITGVKFSGIVVEAPNSLDYEGYLVCVAEEASPLSGTATLSSGVATVSTSAVTANSRIFLQRHAAGGTTAGNVYEVTARTAGTSFTITAIILSTGLTGAADSSTIAWTIVEP